MSRLAPPSAAPQTARSRTSRRAPGPGPAIAVASAATFVALLDVTVVNVAIPDLQRDFREAAAA
jgi:hypothetical protein